MFRTFHRRIALIFSLLLVMATALVATLSVFIASLSDARLEMPSFLADTLLEDLNALLAFALGTVLIAGIAVLLAWFLARGIARPVGRAEEEARHIASGDLDPQSAPTLSEEVRELAEALDKTAAERGQLLAQLETERARVATILAASHDGIIAVNREGEIELANPAAQGLLDTPAVLRPGRPLSEIPVDETLHRMVRESLERREPSHGQVELAHPRRHLDVSAVPLSSNGGQGVVLLIRDLTRIFQRFSKVSRLRSGEGAGLGLSNAKETVEALGGQIWVQSQVGAGSTFSFSVPILSL